MGKSVFIAEKPSVARQFADALKVSGKSYNGYIENDNYILTWCVGHLVTMSYPDAYDPALKSWSLETIPFIPKDWKYQVIDAVKSQFLVVKKILNRDDVDTIYICTDSGREGEYIYRLVDAMAGVKNKTRKRVWIDSQTEEEILKGIKNAKDWSEYDNISAAAYCRAKEDYLMGINFSRVLTLKYGYSIKNYLKIEKNMAISVGRVMTCVLGMIVKREREIRAFEEVPFYRVLADFKCTDDFNIEAEWKVNENSKYYNSPLLYKDNGFKKEETAKELIKALEETGNIGTVSSIQRKQEKKNPPLLYNLAELQNDCSKLFKISPDETLKVVQELYEKKCVTYPRTDARVLSSAIAKEIDKNLRGVGNHPMFKEYTNEIFESGSYKNIGKTKYTNDKLITDHYAIIPTGQGLNNLNSMPPLNVKVYEVIVRRFLSIFYPPALYSKVALTSIMPIKEEEEKKYTETFNANFKVLSDKGYLKVMEYSFIKDKGDEKNDSNADMAIIEKLKKLKKNDNLECLKMSIKEGKTSPPKRYNSGALILAMENAGQLIEDEELREQIKGSGIGTSATRAEIIKKLVTIKYLNLNKKTQIITPTQLGEMIYEVVDCSIKYLLNPELTASWEKGLTYVAEGSISSEEYMEKLEGYVTRRTNAVKAANNQYQMRQRFEEVSKYY
ncbi:MAG: type IA DNA topoisomerase [Lachnospiraceae bacterium]|nr:type IA DNA topoisomerase [Lachnospiraceae bacterium]